MPTGNSVSQFLLDRHDKLILMLSLVMMAMSWGKARGHGLNKVQIRLQTGLSIVFLHCISDLSADLHPSSCTSCVKTMCKFSVIPV